MLYLLKSKGIFIGEVVLKSTVYFIKNIFNRNFLKKEVIEKKRSCVVVE